MTAVEEKREFQSLYDEVLISENVPLSKFVFENVGSFNDIDALIDSKTGTKVTYAQLPVLIRKVAAGLDKTGFKSGDVAACMLPNCIPYPIIFHAVLSLGAAVTTLNPIATPTDISHQVDDSKAKIIFTVAIFLENVIEATKLSKSIETIFVVGPYESEEENVKSYDLLLTNDGNPPKVEFDAKKTIAVIPYSSGTSGYPKGVMLTHYSMVANLQQTGDLLLLEKGQAVLAILPMFHAYGMFAFMTSALRKGALVVIMAKFEPVPFLTTLQQYKISTAHLVPPIVVFLAKHPVVDKFDLSKLEVIFSAAAPMGEELAEQCIKRLGCTILQAYGMTELSPAATISQIASKKYASCGRLVCNTKAKIINVQTGSLCGINERGELCIKGPQIMLGYLNNVKATKLMIDTDGWLHTGDVAYVDEDEDFYIVDRVKELIKYKGFQVAPAELEDYLLRHEAIADAAVIPVDDERAGEIPKAFVVLKPNMTVTEDEIMKFIADQVSQYKKIRLVEFVTSIPKSASGKILRRILKEQEREKAKKK